MGSIKKWREEMGRATLKLTQFGISYGSYKFQIK
jgi:hypothetical protein